jgi:predicted Mrr-cat superfamily restriction endonuclease
LPEITAWVVRAGRGSQHARDFERLGLIAVGFPTVPSVAGWTRDQTLERVVALLEEPSAKALGYASVLYRFAYDINIGDLVMTPDAKSGELLAGRVSGDYEFREPAPIRDHNHVRRVDWLGRIAWGDLPIEVRRTTGAPMAVFQPGAQQALREVVLRLTSA